MMEPNDYGDMDAEASPSEAQDVEDGEEMDETDKGEAKEDEGEQTALLPKSLFGQNSPEPGKICKVKIEHVYGDEIEVSWVKGESESKGKKSTMDEADDRLDRMANKGQ